MLSASAAPAATHAGPKPTIVLVHGAFADASGWSAEIRYLTSHGYPVIAPANPLPPAAQEHMAAHAGAHTVKIHAAHDSLVSHPGAVDRMIVDAANGIR